MATTLPDAAALSRQLIAAAENHATPQEMAALMSQMDLLFAAHQDLVYATCLRFTHEPELAIELAQDTFLLAYERLSTFRGESRFGTWLVSIARFHCLNALRKRRDLLSHDGVLEATDPTRSVLNRLRRQEREELLRQTASAVLNAEEQAAVHLRYTEQLSILRIEELLKLESASGARGLLQRARRKLGRELRRRLT
ncbi:MAG: sigma-70 family RNA polymerase sigma factor, partial [Proteobacteria bacterium]|nr:sigma-70 family RNA polymerase sigma factor [Pseudomonadota bacterium]